MLKIPEHLKAEPFPLKIKPMSPTLIREAFDSKDFIYELKWDGFRAVTYIHNGQVEMFSRKGFSFNDKFQNLLSCFKPFSNNLIFDGEIVATDKQGRADFESLRFYSHYSAQNICYYVFDILYYDKYSLMNIPLVQRKKMLKKVLPEKTLVRYVDHIENKGTDFFRLAEENKLEGIIAKKKASVYVPGIRTKDWLKIKTKSHRDYLEKYPREF